MNKPTVHQPTVAAPSAFALFALALSTLAPIAARAATPGVVAQADDGVGFDVELDPLAYALGGYSLHVGAWLDHWRFDLGAFALAMPEALHGQAGFDASFHGVGAKADYTFADDRSGLFLGVDGGVMSLAVRRDEGAAFGTVYGVGVRTGYRFVIAERLTVTPWISVGRNFGDTELAVGEHTFAPSAWSVFPTVHLGYLID